tara:strand:+ start:706 stop:1131 length:426 start_codon:yes stop_codon:yes gene_type:complete
MTIRVTLQVAGKCTRREYKSHSRAISGLRRWFSGNKGLALLYQPGQQPVVYKNVHELPHQQQISETDFYRTQEWRSLRVEVLAESNRRCLLCGNSPQHGITLHVDHIKPRSLFPELALDKNNLQVLCEDCNLGKMTSELSL